MGEQSELSSQSLSHIEATPPVMHQDVRTQDAAVVVVGTGGRAHRSDALEVWAAVFATRRKEVGFATQFLRLCAAPAGREERQGKYEEGPVFRRQRTHDL